MNVVNLCAVTGGRSDYDLLRNILLLLECESSVDLHVVATGSHLKSEFGSTIEYLRQDDFKKIFEIDILADGDSCLSMASSVAKGLELFPQFLIDHNIDWIIVLGDRFEIFSAVLSARILNISIIHFSGGDTTEGAIDNDLRHSISLMSDFHFVKLKEHESLLLNFGISKKNIEVIGSLSIDNYGNYRQLNLDEINDKFSISISQPFALVSFHPVTCPDNIYDNDIELFLDALFSVDNLFLVFTSSCADYGGRMFNSKIKEYVKSNSERSVYVDNFGMDSYFSLLSIAKLMVGNSSSGILESCNFKLPAVNVLPRQKGRILNDNVISVENNRDELFDAINLAISEDFYNSCQSTINIFDANVEGEISNYVVNKIMFKIENSL